MRLHLPDNLLKRADADLSDLTASQRCGEPYWDPEAVDVLVVPLDPEPSEAEQTAIRRRLVSRDAEDEAHLYDLLDAIADPTAPGWARLALRAELTKYGESEGA